MAYDGTLGRSAEQRMCSLCWELQPAFDDLGMANMEREKVRAMIQDTRNGMAVSSGQTGF